MENNEILVANATENVEQTTEQTPKTYTQEEVDAIVGRKIARTRAKVEKEYDRKYGALTDILEAGTGTSGVEELTDTFSKFYESKGIEVRKDTKYSSKDIEILARAEAEDIIRSGDEDVIEEVDRLANIGIENLTEREKAVFHALATHRQATERGRKLSELGVTEDVYDSKEFKDFAKKFNSSTPIEDVYDIYSRTQPKKEHHTMGSMKNTNGGNSGVKDYYSYEEAKKFTKKDFDNNPALYDAVTKSMQKWK